MRVPRALASALPAEVHRIVFLNGGAFARSTRAFLDRVPNRRMDKLFDADGLRRLVAEAA